MKFALASRPSPDWDGLSGVIDHNILDQGERSIKAYVKVMGTIVGDKNVKKHLSYTFYFEMSHEHVLRLCTETNLKISVDTFGPTECDGFITGSVDQLESCIKAYCQPEAALAMRQLFNSMMTFLEMEGFRFTYNRSELKDRTFKVQ